MRLRRVPFNRDVCLNPRRIVWKIEHILSFKQYAMGLTIVNGSVGCVVVVDVVLVQGLLQLVHSVGHELLHLVKLNALP